MAGHVECCLLGGAVCCERGRNINNEDNYFLNGRYKALGQENVPKLEQCAPSVLGVYAVCDGMGGMACGEQASGLAVALLSRCADELRISCGDPAVALDALRKISASIREKARQERTRMGTSIVMAVTNGSQVDIYNVGDCRGYLVHGGQALQLTHDHTLEQNMRDVGLNGDPLSIRNQLTQHLGMDERRFTLEPYHSRTVLPPGARLLLCSDGLTDTLSSEQLVSVLFDSRPPIDQVRKLIDLALAAGVRDDLTALVVAQI